MTGPSESDTTPVPHDAGTSGTEGPPSANAGLSPSCPAAPPNPATDNDADEDKSADNDVDSDEDDDDDDADGK
jgi:hypothetical protein